MIAPGHQVNSIFQHQPLVFFMDEISGQPLDAAAGLRRLRVQHMRFLALLARLGSLTACAKALHLSQPAVSNLLKDLEAAFGVRLVDRDARGGRLSPAGARVLTRVTHSLAWLEAAQQEAGSPDARPTVRVGLMPIVAYSFMPAVVKGLGAEGGPLRLAFVEATVQRLIELLHEGTIDCVIAMLDSARVPAERLADLKVAPLYQDGLAVACATGHPLLAQALVTHAELLTQEWVLAPQATRTRQVVESSFLGMGLLPPTPLVESGSFHANLALVAQTRMLTVVPSSSVQGYSGAGKVRTLSLVHPFAPSAMNFVTHRDVWETPALQTLYLAMALHAKDWPLQEASHQL